MKRSNPPALSIARCVPSVALTFTLLPSSTLLYVFLNPGAGERPRRLGKERLPSLTKLQMVYIAQVKYSCHVEEQVIFMNGKSNADLTAL